MHRIKKKRGKTVRVLSYLSEYMIPILIFYIVAMGLAKKKQVYEDFMKVAKEGLLLVGKIMPTMIAILTAVSVLRASGFLEFVSEVLEPVAKWLHFPKELVPLSIMKLFSSSGSTGMLLDLYKEYGADSGIGKTGALILSSTETIFYTMSLYFVTAGIKKTRYTLAGCLAASISGMVASVLLASCF